MIANNDRTFIQLFATLALAILLLPTLLSVNVRILMTPGYVIWQSDHKANNRLKSSRGRNRQAVAIIKYLRGRSSRLPNLTTKEKAHLDDVKNLVDLSVGLSKWAPLLMIIVLAALKYSLTWEQMWRRIALASIVQLPLVSALGTVVLIDFDWFFDYFHRLFFVGSSYKFAPESLLVRLFPFDFWAAASWDWIGLTLIELAVLAFIAGFFARFSIESTKVFSVSSD